MDQNNAKGRNFLKVTGILMIIGGAIGLILSIIALLGVGALDYLSGGAVAGLLYASSIFALLGSVLELVAGIVGVANSKKTSQSNHMPCLGHHRCSDDRSQHNPRTRRRKLFRQPDSFPSYRACSPRALHNRSGNEQENSAITQVHLIMHKGFHWI